MRDQRRTFHASVLRAWEHTVVQVPDADGVHAIVPEGAAASDIARAAIALVLGLDPDDIAVVFSDEPSQPRGVVTSRVAGGPSDLA